MLIAVDAGHGGIDTGMKGKNGILEKDIALRFALILSGRLKNPGLDVCHTRIDDSTIYLKERADLIHDTGARYFVSIHTGSSLSMKCQGVRTLFQSHSSESEKLARAIHRQVLRASRRQDLGVLAEDPYLLRETKVPGCLLELCFVNHPEENALLRDDAFLLKTAEAAADGLLQYLELEKANFSKIIRVKNYIS